IYNTVTTTFSIEPIFFTPKDIRKPKKPVMFYQHYRFLLFISDAYFCFLRMSEYLMCLRLDKVLPVVAVLLLFHEVPAAVLLQLVVGMLEKVAETFLFQLFS